MHFDSSKANSSKNHEQPCQYIMQDMFLPFQLGIPSWRGCFFAFFSKSDVVNIRFCAIFSMLVCAHSLSQSSYETLAPFPQRFIKYDSNANTVTITDHFHCLLLFIWFKSCTKKSLRVLQMCKFDPIFTQTIHHEPYCEQNDQKDFFFFWNKRQVFNKWACLWNCRAWWVFKARETNSLWQPSWNTVTANHFQTIC